MNPLNNGQGSAWPIIPRPGSKQNIKVTQSFIVTYRLFSDQVIP